jgi:hypothetical protein
MKKNFITVYWSAAETNPWTSELEIIKIAKSHIICKHNDCRLKKEKDGNIWIPIDKNTRGNLIIDSIDDMWASVDQDDIENLFKENNWEIGEYDFQPVIIDEKFDENMTVRDAFYKSNVIKRIYNIFDNDLDKVKGADMKLKDAKKIKYDTDEYWEMFGDCDSAVRWMIGFMLTNLVK